MKREHNIQTETPLPSGYTRLQYIEATGTQSIGTGYYVGNKKTRIVCEMTKTYSLNDNGVFFGCSSSNDNQWFFNPYFTSNNPVGIMYCYMLGLNYSLVTFHQLNVPTFFDFTIDIPNHTFSGGYVNGDNSASGYTTTFGTIANSELHIFSSVRGYLQNYIHAKMSEPFLIYENDVLIRFFVPALRDSDSKPGLYDTVNGVFYTNKGTGEFQYA